MVLVRSRCPSLGDGLCGDCMRAGYCTELPPPDWGDGVWVSPRSGEVYVHNGVVWELMGDIIGGRLP